MARRILPRPHVFPGQYVIGASLRAGFYDQEEIGSSVDLQNGAGVCVGILQAGSIGTGNVINAFIEESSDNTNWSSVAGATFATVSTSNQLRTISFNRTRRYVRISVNQTVESELCGIVAQPNR